MTGEHSEVKSEDLAAEVRHPVRYDPVVRLLVIACVILLLVGVGYSVWAANEYKAIVALDNPSPQAVLNTVPGAVDDDGLLVPAVRGDDEPLIVLAEKCNLLNEPVLVRGTITWTVIDYTADGRPFNEGTALTTAVLTGVRDPGCEELTFRNPIPPEVFAETERLLQDPRHADDGYIVWQLSALEEAVDYPTAEFERWYTDEFRVYPGDMGVSGS